MRHGRFGDDHKRGHRYRDNDHALVFSRLTLNNTRGYGVTPKIEIVQKELLYQSRVYFTPLKSQDEIDGPAVGRIIKREYERAGLTPAMIHTGAVIITGETSRKQNARSVCREISEIAGDFVVAAAGPDLEAILAGKGAGCQEISQSLKTWVKSAAILTSAVEPPT